MAECRGDAAAQPGESLNNFNNPYNYEGPCIAVDYVDAEGRSTKAGCRRAIGGLFGNLPLAEFSFVKKELTPPRALSAAGAGPWPEPGLSPRPHGRQRVSKYQPVWTAAVPRPAQDAERLLKDFLPRAFRRPMPAGGDRRLTWDRARADRGGIMPLRRAMRIGVSHGALFAGFSLLAGVAGRSARQDEPDQYAVASRPFLLPSGTRCRMTTDQARGKSNRPWRGAREAGRADARRPEVGPLRQRLPRPVAIAHEIDSTSPDEKLYPEFRPICRDAMLAETRAFFREMLTQESRGEQLHRLGLPHDQSAARRALRSAGRGGLRDPARAEACGQLHAAVC